MKSLLLVCLVSLYSSRALSRSLEGQGAPVQKSPVTSQNSVPSSRKGVEESPPDARLEVTSKEKARFMGLCVSEDGKQQKKIEGVTPAEFQIDMKLYRCEVKPENQKKSLGVRFFHQRQIVFEKTKPENATSGIEFVIPWGR